MSICSAIMPDLKQCYPVKHEDKVKKLIDITKDKFLKFLVKNGVEVTEIRSQFANKSACHEWKHEANLIIVYWSYNLEGKYWMKLTEKQLDNLFKK